MNKFDFIDYDTLTNDNCGITIYKGNVDTSLIGKIILNGVEITDIDSWNKAIATFNDLNYQIKEKDKEIERLNNIIDEVANDILKELNENRHLSYGVALAIRQKLIDYRELKEGK